MQNLESDYLHQLYSHSVGACSDEIGSADTDDDDGDDALILELYRDTEEDPDDYGEWGDELDDNDDDEWDNPEPLAEYDNELRQSPYAIDENDIEFGIELRIDQWVSTLVDVATDAQRSRIVELLHEIGRRRQQRLLRWLSKQEWNGNSLLLFLRFRFYWESNPHWWEHCFWDWRAHCWHPTRNRYNLTLDDTYDLVRRRLNFRPGEIIEEAWLFDWINFSLWQYGFLSFASFAVFRASLTDGESWQQHIEWYLADELLRDRDGLYWSSEDRRLHGYGPPVWFAEQNWYDPDEWHDKLGW